MREIRVFSRRTNATPGDECAVVNRTPELFDEADRVMVSVSFKCDIERAERLAFQWQAVTKNVEIGGPAFGDRGGGFVPGRFIKKGYVITSRGCPNRCWFCDAWRNEGNEVRLLPIMEGFNVLDNNLLACPDEHVESVFEMLLRQKERPCFTGGFEAKRLKGWHVERLVKLKPDVAWFAYDTPDDYEPLAAAGRMLREAGIIKAVPHDMCCYVLVGWQGDSFEAAEKRLTDVVRLGFFPQAMLYDRGVHFEDDERLAWKRFAREWAGKIIVGSKVRKIVAATT